MLKLWSLIYRLTGWYSPFAELAQYRHLSLQWYAVERILAEPTNDLDLDTLIAIEIGLWQAEHGFTRRFRGLEE